MSAAPSPEAPSPATPLIRPVGDRALLVEFGTVLSETAHSAVIALDRALAAAPPEGLAEVVPANVNLLVVFDPLTTDHATMTALLRGLIGRAGGVAARSRLHEIPVCYDDAFAPDLAEVAARTGLSPEAVIATHLSGEYEVYMYGFAPGYAYLSGVPEPIRLPRKTTALRGIPAGSVIVAAGQCLVTSLTMPTGWWIIGRSPARILTGDPARPFLFDAGDRVRFRRTGSEALGTGA